MSIGKLDNQKACLKTQQNVVFALSLCWNVVVVDGFLYINSYCNWTFFTFSHWSATAELAAAQEKQMEVCEVCGAFLIVGDAQQRIDDHLMGKQHVGY